MALLLFLAAGCIHLGMQFAELSRARSEIQQAKLEVLKVHSAMQEEVITLREELAMLQMLRAEPVDELNATIIDGSVRDKRSIAKAGKPGKSKESKYLKPGKPHQNSSTFKSSSLKKHSGIFLNFLSVSLVLLMITSSSMPSFFTPS